MPIRTKIIMSPNSKPIATTNVSLLPPEVDQAINRHSSAELPPPEPRNRTSVDHGTSQEDSSGRSSRRNLFGHDDQRNRYSVDERTSQRPRATLSATRANSGHTDSDGGGKGDADDDDDNDADDDAGDDELVQSERGRALIAFLARQERKAIAKVETQFISYRDRDASRSPSPDKLAKPAKPTTLIRTRDATKDKEAATTASRATPAAAEPQGQPRLHSWLLQTPCCQRRWERIEEVERSGVMAGAVLESAARQMSVRRTEAEARAAEAKGRAVGAKERAAAANARVDAARASEAATTERVGAQSPLRASLQMV